MGERITNTTERKIFRRGLALAGISALALSACGGGKSGSYNETITVTASPTASKSETPLRHPKPKDSETSAPSATETEKPATGYDAIASKSFPAKGQSYLESLPKVPQNVKDMVNMSNETFSKQNINQILEFKDYIMPDKAGSANVVGKWAEKTDSLPYTTPTKDMKSIDILDNNCAEANFIQHKAGTGLGKGAANLNLDLTNKLTASQYYFDGYYDTDNYQNYVDSANSFYDYNKAPNMTGPSAPMGFNSHIAVKDVTDNPNPTTMVNGKSSPLRVMEARYTDNDGNSTYYQVKAAYYDNQYLITGWSQDDPYNFDSNQNTIETNEQYFN